MTKRLRCLLVLALFTTGCAGAAASVRPIDAASSRQDLSQYRALGLRMIKADSATMSSQDLDRILARIVTVIQAKQPARFSEVNGPTTGDAASAVLDVTVTVTRYDEGSAFARAMLAGLGQIHIDGTVSLRDRARDVPLGEYEVNKTFAWGGVYGASTSIRDVEEGFAQGVATLILGEESK